MAKKEKKKDNNKFSWRFGEIALLTRMKNDSSTLENSLAVPQNVKHVPGLPLLDMYSRERKMHFYVKTWTQIS